MGLISDVKQIWSPLEIIMMMKAYYSADGISDQRERSESHLAGFKRLINDGLVCPDGYATDQGKAMVADILGTPIPSRVWVSGARR